MAAGWTIRAAFFAIVLRCSSAAISERKSKPSLVSFRSRTTRRRTSWCDASSSLRRRSRRWADDAGRRSDDRDNDRGGSDVKPEVAALLEVQTEDLKSYEIEDKLSALMPRLAALEQDQKRAAEAVAQAHKQVESEEQRQREVQDRLRQHREMRDKSETLLGQVTAPREAAAAMAQIEQAKRFIADEERDLGSLQLRLTELRKLTGDRELAVKEFEKVREARRVWLAADRAALEKELTDVRGTREKKSAGVPRSLLQ